MLGFGHTCGTVLNKEVHKACTLVLGILQEYFCCTDAEVRDSSIFHLIKADCNNDFLFALTHLFGHSNVGRKAIYQDLVYQ